MKIEEVRDLPPNYREIDKKFKIGNKKIIFAYGNRIYNPSGIEIPPQLRDHEYVHCYRQKGQPEEWWRAYIDDPVFRLNEEIPAHIAEYENLIRHGSRNERRMAAKLVSERLAAPLYGGLITKAKAKKLLVASGV